MGIGLAALPPDAVVAMWGALRPMLERGFDAGASLMPDDFLDEVKAGKVLVWCAAEQETANIVSVATTRLVPMRGGLVCWICQCSGEHMANWLHFIGRLEAYAKAEGCVRTIIQGRRGWERVLGDEGYRVRTVQLEKSI